MTVHEHTYDVHPLSTVGRVIGEVKCGDCDWCALMTGDTEGEVHVFLVARLIEHVEQIHRRAHDYGA